MRWWETEGRRRAGMKRVKSERMGVYALFAIVVLASASGNLSQTAVNAMLGDIMLQFGLTVDLGQWLTTSYMLVLGITVPVATFLSRRFSVRQQVFIALGQAKVSIFIAMLRKLILLIPLVLILPHFITPQTTGVIIAEPIADITAALTCCALFAWKCRRLLNGAPETPPQEQ